MENEGLKGEEQWLGEERWLAKIASEYDGSLPYQDETEVILWLRGKVAETENSEELKHYKALLDEAQDFGGSDDGGTFDPGLVRFARLLQLLKSRVQDR